MPVAQEDVKALVHELEVHQIELEMQNEELRRANLDVERGLTKYTELYDLSPIGYFTFDPQGKIQGVNLTGARLLGLERSRLLNRSFRHFVELEGRPVFAVFCQKVLETDIRQICEVKLLPHGKPPVHVQMEGIIAEENQEKEKQCWAAVMDITERKKAEEAVQDALRESRQRQAEIAALLESSRAVLEHPEFKAAARSIFNSCKKIIGAPSGYIALLSKDGAENELLFLDSGGLPCGIDPSLPMPIRGMWQESYRTGKPVYHNDFSKSEWTKYLPEGQAPPKNVLFAPLMIEGKVVGLLGLANKPGGFTPNDARLASAFSENASIALFNSRVLETLENSEERFRSVVQTATDAILSIDNQGKIVFWNPGAEKIFGYSADEAAGKPLSLMISAPFRDSYQQEVSGAVKAEFKIIGETMELTGRRKGGSEFPLELSRSTWKTKEGVFFTAIIRDISERKRAEEEISHLAKFPAEDPSPVLRLDHEGRILYANDASQSLLRVWGSKVGGYAPPFWRDSVMDSLEKKSERVIEVNAGEQIYALLVAPIPEAGYVNLYGSDITEGKQMEKALRQAHDLSEIRVQERTAELVTANEALRAEITERKRAEEALQESEKQLKHLSSQLLTAQENERRRISRELHDGVGQTLSALKFSLERKLSEMKGGVPPPGITLEEILPMLQEGIAEVRRLSSDLRPSMLDDLGILSTIDWFCRQFQTIYTNIRIEKEVECPGRRSAGSIEGCHLPDLAGSHEQYRQIQRGQAGSPFSEKGKGHDRIDDQRWRRGI